MSNDQHPNIQPIKPTLSTLRDRHHFDVAVLARAASVHETIVIRMLRGHKVYAMNADKILAALSGMTGVQYNRDNVRVLLIDEGKEGTL